MDGPAGSQKAWFAVGGFDLRKLLFYVFFRRLFFSIFFDVKSILKGLGRPKRRPTSIFGKYFCDPFDECVSTSIFGCFFEAPNLKNSNFVSTGARFSLNRRFRKSSEKTWIWAPLSEAQTKKIREKIVLKNVCFFDLDFLEFFCDFLGFWLDFGKP